MCINENEFVKLSDHVMSVKQKQDICFAVTEQKFTNLQKDIMDLKSKLHAFEEMPSKVYGILTKFLAGALSIGMLVFGGTFFWINDNYKTYTTQILELKTDQIKDKVATQDEKIIQIESQISRVDYRLRNTNRIINQLNPEESLKPRQ